MSQVIRIAPSVLSADFSRLGDQVRAAEAAGADVIHLDVMDGQFVPNITIGPLVVAAVRSVTELPLDVHLMIDRPERYIEAFAKAGADYLSVHPEATVHLHRALQQIRGLGLHPGVALNPATPESVLQYVVADLDLVLVMTVNPGFGGQTLIPAMMAKINAVRRMLDQAGSSAWLSVDGGIDPVTGPDIVAHGATMLVAGSAIYGAPEGVAAAIHALREAVTQA
ncbi:MAG: ribulose-phosphate 3-epimerase [Anaerolineae bacterium]|nr:ribulose-phosphate 3-epimerase [Anaerolineae bacterium]